MVFILFKSIILKRRISCVVFYYYLCRSGSGGIGVNMQDKNELYKYNYTSFDKCKKATIEK